MLRREARLRKEFLYRKALEESEKKLQDKKQKLKSLLETNSPIPPDLKEEAGELLTSLVHDPQTNNALNFDDEYASAGVIDPKILITTSRDPSSRLLQFAKELKLIVPNSQRINRGNHVISEITAACKSNEITDLIILHEHRGVPDGLIISHFPHGPTAFFSLSNVVLRHDIPSLRETKISEAYPHLVFSHFSSRIGLRTRTILKHIFPVPKEDSKRCISFINQDDFISFRHHTFKSDHKDVTLDEVGPRFELRLFQIRLGTIENAEADLEWVLRPYMNTAKKRTAL